MGTGPTGYLAVLALTSHTPWVGPPALSMPPPAWTRPRAGMHDPRQQNCLARRAGARHSCHASFVASPLHLPVHPPVRAPFDHFAIGWCSIALSSRGLCECERSLNQAAAPANFQWTDSSRFSVCVRPSKLLVPNPHVPVSALLDD